MKEGIVMISKPTRRRFDPTSIDDLRAYRRFLASSKWDGSCPFEVEFPHTTIPYMITEKIIKTYLDKIIAEKEQLVERDWIFTTIGS